MKGYNKCIFAGLVGQDPELKSTTSNQYINFSLAVSNKYKSKTGEFVSNTVWIPCIVWGKLAEIFNEYVRKGSQLLITGRLDISEYEQDGVKKKSTKVIVDEMNMLGNAKSTDRQTTTSAINESDDLPF